MNFICLRVVRRCVSSHSGRERINRRPAQDMGGMEALAAAEKAFSEGGVSFESEGMEQVMFAEQGNERLGAFESALLAEARARPDACGRALDKATALVGTAHRAEVAGGGSQVGELFVEDALAKSLARFENSLLIRARSEASSHAVIRADKTITSMQLQAPVKDSVGTGKRSVARPASAPLAHVRASATGSHIRIRQRTYDDKRVGRKRHDGELVYTRPEPEFFDAEAACNHNFKPVRVRRDENGRLQPRVSNRLLRMSMPTFMGVPVESADPPVVDWGTVVKEATDMVWTQVAPTKDALSQHFGFADHFDEAQVKHNTHLASGPSHGMKRKKVQRNRPHRSETEKSQTPIKPHDHYLGMRVTWHCIGKNAFGSRVVDNRAGLEKMGRGQAGQRINSQVDALGGQRMRQNMMKDLRASARDEEIARGLSEEEEVKKEIATLSKRRAVLQSHLEQIQAGRHSTSAHAVTKTEETETVQSRFSHPTQPLDLKSFADQLEEGMDG